jgi:hypothetical protein
MAWNNHWKNRLAISVALAGLAAAGQTASAIRIAVVGENDEQVAQLIQLAQAQTPDVQFVERTEISRILDEQKLSLAGIVNAKDAVHAGNLLGADVLAVVEVDPKQHVPAGIVLFDSHTGERLTDVALDAADEKNAAAIANALREGARKAQVQRAKRRAVCVLTVRNVDLPRSDDLFCRAVGHLMERRLLTSPDIVLLERERFNELRQEQNRTGSGGENLIPSLTLLELQLARDENGRIRATCVPTGLDGKRAGDSASAVTADRQADELATALAKSLALILKVAPPTAENKPADRRAEAQRFYREARFWQAHNEPDRPVQALEAAVALDPDNLLLRSELSFAMVSAGVS